MLIVTKNEESTFWLLKELIDNTIPFYHIKTMAGLIRDIDVLSELVKKKLPDVHNHINNLGILLTFCILFIDLNNEIFALMFWFRFTMGCNCNKMVHLYFC